MPIVARGLDAWITGFEDLPLRAEVAVEEEWRLAAGLFVDEVRARVHVLTGALKASGHVLPPTFAPGIVEQAVMFVGRREALSGSPRVSRNGKTYVPGQYGIYEQGRGGEHAFLTRAYEEGGRELFLAALHEAFGRLAASWR